MTWIEVTKKRWHAVFVAVLYGVSTMAGIFGFVASDRASRTATLVDGTIYFSATALVMWVSYRLVLWLLFDPLPSPRQSFKALSIAEVKLKTVILLAVFICGWALGGAELAIFVTTLAFALWLTCR